MAPPAESAPLVLCERDAERTTVTLSREDKLNALSLDLIQGLSDLFRQLTLEPTARRPRVVILRGGGERAFAAGADVEEMNEKSPAAARRYSEAGQRLALQMEAAPFPIVAMVHGFALGGGCELALAADFIIASTKARFGQPEVKLGLMPGFGATARLSRRIGIARARELIYTGRLIEAEEALRIGLVNQVCEPDELVEHTESLAKTIAANAPLAVASAKRVLERGQDSSMQTATELEANAFALLFGTDDARAGMKDFVGKRSGTRFEGK